MPIKIIKRGAEQAAGVRPFSFLQNPTEPQEVVAAPLWIEAGAGSNATEILVPREAAKPAEAASTTDLAQVEKVAYENGFRQGEKAGKEIAERKVEAVMRRYAETLLEIGRLRTKVYAQIEREVVKLAVEVAKKIVHREIQADKDIIQTLVRVALSHVAENTAVTVHLNPVDYNYMLEHRGELSQNRESGREIVLLADRSIERGGCLVQTECGEIDARIEEEFREVERNFFEGRGNE